MYIPDANSVTDIETLTGFIERHPLGLLVSSGSRGLLATPVPFLYRKANDRPTLATHLARANNHWKDLVEPRECLVLFQGPNTYITPDWYPSKQINHEVAPTWNYEIVQVKGISKTIEEADWIRDLLRDMTNQMELKRKNPWKITDAPDNFIKSLLTDIVGIEIEISEIKGKSKMSQNRSIEDIKGVVKGLSDPDDPHCNMTVAEIVSTNNAVKL